MQALAPLAIFGIDVGDLVGDVVRSLIDLLVPDFTGRWANRLVAWLVALPQVTDWTQFPALNAFRRELTAVGYGLLIPFFFITSGMAFDLDALTSSTEAALKMVMFVGLFLVVRGIPALLLYRGEFPAMRDRVALASDLDGPALPPDGAGRLWLAAEERHDAFAASSADEPVEADDLALAHLKRDVSEARAGQAFDLNQRAAERHLQNGAPGHRVHAVGVTDRRPRLDRRDRCVRPQFVLARRHPELGGRGGVRRAPKRGDEQREEQPAQHHTARSPRAILQQRHLSSFC